MNVLGHPYVAWKAVGRLNKYLVAGSHLPDLVPFVPDSVFSFEEIHESPEKVLRFLEKNYPYARDLALGMMSHSVKFGADKFNQEVEQWLIGRNKRIKEKIAVGIADCTKLSLEAARGYIIHNFLWGGMDVYLLKNKQGEVEKLAKVHGEIDQKEIASFLAECFRKKEKEVRRMVDWFLGPVKPESFVSLEGMVRTLKKLTSGLPEFNGLDEKKTSRFLEEIYALFENRWEGILEKVVAETKKNLSPFV